MDDATQRRLQQEVSPLDDRQKEILDSLNFYFSWGNLIKDDYLQKVIRETDFNGYILLTEILGEPGFGSSWNKKPWKKMEYYNAKLEDVKYLEQYAETWELNEHKLMIREKTNKVN